jgi:hypothetical protein
MDGLLDQLKDLIGQTKLDFIEAFTPPPMGNLSVADALKAWPDKLVWINFPAVVIAEGDTEKSRKYTLDLLNSIDPTQRFLIGCTENYPLDKWEKGYKGVRDAIDEFCQ